MSEPLFETEGVTTYPVNLDCALALKRATGEVVELDRATASVLGVLQGRRTLQEHAVAAWQAGVCGDPAVLDRAFNTLWDLELLRECDCTQSGGVASTTPAFIDTVAIVTADRPRALQRCLESLIRHLDACDVHPRIVVVDGSRHRRCLIENNAFATHMSRCRRVQYFGPREAATLRSELEIVGACPESVAVALTPGSIGSNRNLVMLLTAGEHLLMIDDDILCEPWELPDCEPGLEFGGHLDLRQWHFFETRGAALADLRPSSKGLLQAHRDLLGRSLGELVSCSVSSPECSQSCGHLLRALSTRVGCVRLTFAGLAGDSAGHCPGRLLFLSGPTSNTLRSNEGLFTTAFSSREVRRIARRTIVTHDPGCMGYCMGVANTSLLPPFMPVGRNEDGVFGSMLAFADRGALFAHLPIGIIHDSDRPAEYSGDRMVSARRTRLSELIIAILRLASTSTLAAPIQERLNRLGRLFIDVAQQPTGEFVHFLKESVLAARCSELARAATDIASARQPDYWREAFDEYHRTFCAGVLDGRFFIPEDFGESSPDRAFRDSQAFVKGFGDLVEAWPEIWRQANARRLESLV